MNSNGNNVSVRFRNQFYGIVRFVNNHSKKIEDITSKQIHIDGSFIDKRREHTFECQDVGVCQCQADLRAHYYGCARTADAA